MSEEDKFVCFERWLRENGAEFPKVELQDYGDEVRGCHCTEKLDNQEVIISIPLKCLITVEMGRETSMGQAIIDAALQVDAPKHVFIMLFILFDRKDPNSFFKPYYDTLPPTLSNMPIFWSDKELELLDGSYFLEQVHMRNEVIAKDYESICRIAPELRDVATLDEFKWARMAVCSRNFGIQIKGVRTSALVPYADMLNHYRPRDTCWQFEESVNAFTVIALHDMSCGVAVNDSYGQKCNHRFLLNYGFSIENNLEESGMNPNEIPVLLTLPEDDLMFDAKFALWSMGSLTPWRRIRIGVFENENFGLLFALCRLICADPGEFTSSFWSKGSRPRGLLRSAQLPISRKNELNLLKMLRDICQKNLSLYPNTYVEDCKALYGPDSPADYPLYSNQRHAKIQMKGEKEVLLFYLRLADVGLGLLTAGNDEVVAFENSIQLLETSCEEYKAAQLVIWNEYAHFTDSGDRLGKYFDGQNRMILTYARVQLAQIVVNERAVSLRLTKEMNRPNSTAV